MLENKLLQNDEKLLTESPPVIVNVPDPREDQQSSKESKEPSDDALAEAVRAYREIRDKNSIMWRNFKRLPPPELTKQQIIDTYSEVREVRKSSEKPYVHPMNEVCITASFDKEKLQITFNLYQGKYLSDTNRQRVVSLDYIPQYFKDYIINQTWSIVPYFHFYFS